MERNYETVFKNDSPPGHHWNDKEGEPFTTLSDQAKLDRRQHWKAGQVFSEFTWDIEKDGPYPTPPDIFEVREVK